MRRRRPRYRLTDLIANTDLIELTDEDREWLDMVPVGREFGSPDFERLTDLNPLDIDPTSNPSLNQKRSEPMKTNYGITLKPRTGKHPPVPMDLRSDEGKRRFREAVTK